MRTPLRLLVLAVTAVLAALTLAVPASATTKPYCGITWGSTAKVNHGADYAGDFIYDVRAGRHACYDRLVVDLGEAGGYDAWSVRYVGTVHEEATGNAIPLRGGAYLEVVVYSVNYDESGHATYTPRRSEVVNVSSFRTFRQVAWGGSFEGQTTLGLGVRARLPFRVFTLDGPPGSGQDMRLVIDVAHRW